MTCPVKTDPSWIKLTQVVPEEIAYWLWDKYEGNVPEKFLQETVQYEFKLTQKVIENLPRIKTWWNNISIPRETLWKKIQELGIPREQLNLLKEQEGNTVEEKLVNFLANYSYTVEINTAKQTNIQGEYDEEGHWITYDDLNQQPDKNLNTQYYSNLKVPGGTNYTENEIATPAITPSIKGHAQFSTDKGVGWFRSDEQTPDTKKVKQLEQELEEAINSGNAEPGMRPLETYSQLEGSKTRRILEIQSDLFQKGRERDRLTEAEISYAETFEDVKKFENKGYKAIGANEDGTIDFLISDSKNQFLQLLNKDNNWVRFFIQSIIQDSAKKGYEKVLFPTGDTASKVEGHTTLEEFKKQKEGRIKELEKETHTYRVVNRGLSDFYIVDEENFSAEAKFVEMNKKFFTREAADTAIINHKRQINNEITQLKQELERIEKEGFGALKPIFNFYENTVTNILKKLGSVKQITDEYGNTWNEVTLTKDVQEKVLPIMFQRQLGEGVVQSYLNTENRKEILLSLSNAPEMKVGSEQEKMGFLATNLIQRELDGLRGKGWLRIQGNKVTVLFGEKIKPGQARAVTRRLVHDINSKHLPEVFREPLAKYEENAQGDFYVTFKPNPAYARFLLDMSDKLRQDEFDREVSATLDWLEIHEASERQDQDFLERQSEGQWLTIDGEVVPVPKNLPDLANLAAIADIEGLEDYTHVLNALAARFVGVNWMYDPHVESHRVDFENGIIRINPYLIQKDTPWHEFGHLIIRDIRLNNPELFEALKKNVMDLNTHENSAVNTVFQLYPDLIGTVEFWEEAINTELGRQAAQPKNLFQRIWDWFMNRFKGHKLPNNATIKDLVRVFQNEKVFFAPTMKGRVMEQRIITDRDLLEQISAATESEDGNYVAVEDKLRETVKKVKEDWENIKSHAKLALEGERNSSRIVETQINKILDAINKDQITLADLKEGFKEFTIFMKYSSVFLRLMNQHLGRMLDDETKETSDKLRVLYHVNQLAITLDTQTGMISRRLFSGENLERNIFNVYRKELVSQIDNIKNKFTKQKTYVAEELAKIYERPLKELEKQRDEELKTLQEAKDKYVTERDKTRVQKRIDERSKWWEENLPTKTNIHQWLSNPTKEGFFSAAFESAVQMKSAPVQMIAESIETTLKDGEREAFKFFNKTQALFSRILKLRPEFLNQAIDVRRFYGFMLRKSTRKDGSASWGFNTQMKVPELEIKHKELITNYKEAKGTPEEDKALDLLEEFEEKYMERRFNDEYYRIQNLLPKDIRKKRRALYEELELEEMTIGLEDVSEEALERRREILDELVDMEREFDSFGRPKEDEALRIARTITEWKKEKQAKNLYKSVLTEHSKNTFNSVYGIRKAEYDRAMRDPSTSLREKNLVTDEFNRWRSIYVKDEISKEFYEERFEITSEIDEILQKYKSEEDFETTIDENYDLIFRLLKGYRDQDGIYDGSRTSPELQKEVQDAEQRIETLKEAVKDSRKISKDDKRKLSKLFKQLQDIQRTVPTEYYDKVVAEIKAELKTNFTIKFPKETAERINEMVEMAYEKSDWYRTNHIFIEEYDPTTRTHHDVAKPTILWRRIIPTNEDHIQRNSPSKYWYTYEVNDSFRNTNFVPGKSTFKVVRGEFYNDEWDKLSAEEQSIINDTVKLYEELQGDLYKRHRNGQLLPNIRKNGTEALVDQATFRTNYLKLWYHKLRAMIRYGDNQSSEQDEVLGEPTQADIWGQSLVDNPTRKQGRRLFMRYSRPIPIEEQSTDVFKVLNLYAMEATRFAALRKEQSRILSMDAAFDIPETDSGRKALSEYINRNLYGEHKRDIGQIGNAVTQFTGYVSGLAAKMVLSQNIKSVAKNLVAGLLQSSISSGIYDVSAKDFLFGLKKATRSTFAFPKNELQAGNKSLDFQLVDFYTGTQKNISHQAARVKNTAARKYGNVLHAVQSLRDASEFLIQSQIMYAVMNSYSVDSPQGKIKIWDAYELVNGQIQPKLGVVIPKSLEDLIRAKIMKLNTASQGLYRESLQPYLSKLWIGRTLGWMNRWVVSNALVRYQGERIHYASATIATGYHRQLGAEALNLIKAAWAVLPFTPQESFNPFEFRTGSEKKALKALPRDTAIITALTILSYMAFGGDDDDDQDIKDYAAWFTRSVADEMESFNPVMGPLQTYNGFVAKKAGGRDIVDRATERFFGAYKKTLRLFDKRYLSSEPFYSYYSNSDKINYNRTDPTYAGKPSNLVLLSKLMGLEGLDLSPLKTEYTSRQLSEFLPKTYLPEHKRRYGKSYEQKVDIKHKEDKPKSKSKSKSRLRNARKKHKK